MQARPKKGSDTGPTAKHKISKDYALELMVGKAPGIIDFEMKGFGKIIPPKKTERCNRRVPENGSEAYRNEQEQT